MSDMTQRQEQWTALGEGPGPDGWLVLPEGEPVGSVVVCSEMFGVTEYVRGICRDLAAAGYSALAPDFYWRQGRHTELSYEPSDREVGLGMMRRLMQQEVLSDAAAALITASRHAGSGGTAFLGLSLGGHIALRAATRLRFDLAVLFYPGWLLTSALPLAGPVPPAFESESIASNGAFVLGFVGDQDQVTSATEWRAVGERFTAAGVPHELVGYPGAGHGFACQDRPAGFDEKASADAWRRVFEALDARVAHRQP